jgi:hypothetical protein
MATKKKPAAEDLIPLVPVTPGEYFTTLKNKKQSITTGALSDIYDNCLQLLEKYEKTNQVDAMKKLMYHLEVIEKEHAVLATGIDTFVYLSDVKQFIEKVQDRVVKIIELERYEREIPDDVIAKWEPVKDIFTEFLVVFTDYTKEHVDKTKKERDPILFGMFQDKETKTTADRLYFIGDWEDEYCDLTLNKLVVAMKSESSGKEVEFKFRDPANIVELRAKLKALDDEKRNGRMNSNFIYQSNATTSTALVTNGIVLTQEKTPIQEEAPVKTGLLAKVKKVLRL